MHPIGVIKAVQQALQRGEPILVKEFFPVCQQLQTLLPAAQLLLHMQLLIWPWAWSQTIPPNITQVNKCVIPKTYHNLITDKVLRTC